MNGRRSSSRLFAFVAALMLAVIGMQATPTDRLPVAPVHGSVFSAATVEVTLAPWTNQEAGLTQLPALPPRLVAVEYPARAGTDTMTVAWRGLAWTGPPSLAVSILPYPPRAPPFA